MKNSIMPFIINYNYFKILKVACVILFFFPNTTYAAEKFIGGGGDNLFSNPANWDGGSLPDLGDDIEIKANCIFDQPGSIEYDKLKIRDGATLTWLNNSLTLNIEDLDDHNSGGILDMSNAGILIIRDEWKASIDNLVFIPGPGTVVFLETGNNSQIPNEFLADIAYGWGNHEDAGYLTSFSELDPIFSASPASGIGLSDISNWNTAYGWGDHSGAGYLTSFTESDPLFGASSASGILGSDLTNWNTAYGWGDHSGAGYLSSLSGAVLTTTDQIVSGEKTFTSDAIINGITVGAGPNGAGGTRNTALGLNALSNNAYGGHHNVAIGTNAMKNNTTGSFNIANGFWALTNNTTGIHNAANGRLTLSENVSGSYNSATGSGALNKNTTGSYNTATGSFALFENTTGSQNTASGYYSLNNNVTGNQNTAIGDKANVSSGSLTNSTAIGANAIVDASNKIQLGNNAINSVQLGTGSNVTLETGLIKITGGSPAAGKVLTSDIDGLASWQNAASELDPIFAASSASSISVADLAAWNSAYSWGDHSAAGYLTSSGTLQGTGVNSFNIRASDEGSIAGNARGEYSVDLQTFRASATQVASGYVSTIGGGYSNTASGSRSTIGGGYINTASGFESIVGGGSQNTASQSYSTIGGGLLNTASGYSSTIAGGNGNNASVNYATVGGGTSNTASGHYSSVPGGLNIEAQSYGESVLGLYNELAATPNANSYVATDRLFVLGNGTSAGNRSNAMVVLKNGNTGIGTSSPAGNLHVDAGTGLLNILTIGGGNTAVGGNTNMVIGRTAAVGGAMTIDPFHSGGGIAPLLIGSLQGAAIVGIGTASPGGQFELGLDQGRKPSTSTWTITSDKRLKNVNGSYDKGLKEIMQLEPIRYHYKNVGQKKFNKNVLTTENVGFSAQAVQEVFPESVGTDNDGYLNFNMHAILVAQVNAIKEQQGELDSKDERIADLENKVDWLMAQVSILTGSEDGNSGSPIHVTLTGSELPWIQQNIPNPFRGRTTINYFIPESNNEAVIEFFDIQGKLIQSTQITEKGKGSIKLDADNLSSGIYVYKLVVDGRSIDTKKMQYSK